MPPEPTTTEGLGGAVSLCLLRYVQEHVQLFNAHEDRLTDGRQTHIRNCVVLTAVSRVCSWSPTATAVPSAVTN